MRRGREGEGGRGRERGIERERRMRERGGERERVVREGREKEK